MRRVLSIVAATAAVWAMLAQSALAQFGQGASFERGTGFYFSWTKIVILWLFFLVWVKTTDWVNRDAQKLKLNFAVWNFAVFASFAVTVLLTFVIPIFWISLPLLLIAYWVPLGIYVAKRNKLVPFNETVLSGSHIRYLLTKQEVKSPDEVGPPVKLLPMGAASERDDNINLLTARQSPGFIVAREMLFDALSRRSDAIMLDYTQTSVGVKYQIDGLWHDAAARDRESGDAVLAVLKVISSLNVNERRAKQQGEFKAEFQPQINLLKKVSCLLLSQGTPTGERALIQFSDGKPKSKSLEELGLRDKLVEQFKTEITSRNAFFLVTAPPGGGLTTTFNAVVMAADRFTRHWIAIEPAGHREQSLENVPIDTYDAAVGETPATILPRLIRSYPDCYVVRDLVNAETVDILSEEITMNNRLVIAAIRAKDSSEALLRVLALKANPKKFAAAVSAVLNQRLVRMLCQNCKMAYAPPPQLLQQLRIPPGKIEAFYQPPPLPEDPKLICRECGGVGYIGRTGLFELLIVNDRLREVLAQTPKLDVLRAEARKAGLKTMMEEGILLVCKGVTSLQELQRVLKE